MPLYAGQGVGRIVDVVRASDRLRHMAEEASGHLVRIGKLALAEGNRA